MSAASPVRRRSPPAPAGDATEVEVMREMVRVLRDIAALLADSYARQRRTEPSLALLLAAPPWPAPIPGETRH